MHGVGLINRLVEDPLRHLIVASWLLAAPTTVWAFTGGGTTGDTGYRSPTTVPTTATTGDDTGTGTGTTPVDTGPPACLDCNGAADLAGEEGGSSCAVVPGAAPGVWALALLLAAGRRRA